MPDPAHSPRVTFRFYEELNRFLAPERRKRDFELDLPRATTLSAALRVLRVPFGEADLVLVNGAPARIDHVLNDGDRVSVYPVFEAFDISSVPPLAAAPLRDPRFVLDVHLGKLARKLRLLGFDSIHEPDFEAAEMRRIAAAEGRIILSRGGAALEGVDRAYRVRSELPSAQLIEVLDRLDLRGSARPFTRCLCCNGDVRPAAKEDVIDRLPPRTRELFDDFLRCTNCGNVYWEGSHWERLREEIAWALSPDAG